MRIDESVKYFPQLGVYREQLRPWISSWINMSKVGINFTPLYCSEFMENQKLVEKLKKELGIWMKR